MNDLYQLLMVDDVQKDDSNIIHLLSQIMDGKLKNDLRLLNYFQEVPVCFGATVDFVERGMVEMTVHQNQAIAMQAQKMTFLKSSHFPHDVLAKVQRVKAEKNLVFLTTFSYVQIRSERREYVRVQVDNLNAQFQCENQVVQGKLLDISLGGAAIQAGVNGAVEADAKVTVRLSFPDATLEVPGRLLRALTDGAKCKYIIEFETSPRSEEAISHYIFRRQGEIIRELKDQI